MQRGGKKTGHLPDDRSEEAVETAEEPNTLRERREDLIAVRRVKRGLYELELDRRAATLEMTSCMSLLGW